MKISKSLTGSILATAIAASAAFAPVANAEVSASVGVANMYLFRGADLGDGDAAVFGDLGASAGGFYTGVWASSGDATLGTEYDLYAGWEGDFGPVSVDFGAITYVYPDGSSAEEQLPLVAVNPVTGAEEEACGGGTVCYAPRGGASRDDTLGDYSEAYLVLGLGPVEVAYYDNIAGDSGYTYYSIAGMLGDFTLLAGQHHNDGGDKNDPVHIDLSYAYNDNLNFTVSKVVQDEVYFGDDNINFVVSYSLPIE